MKTIFLFVFLLTTANYAAANTNNDSARFTFANAAAEFERSGPLPVSVAKAGQWMSQGAADSNGDSQYYADGKISEKSIDGYSQALTNFTLDVDPFGAQVLKRGTQAFYYDMTGKLYVRQGFQNPATLPADYYPIAADQSVGILSTEETTDACKADIELRLTRNEKILSKLTVYESKDCKSYVKFLLRARVRPNSQ